MGYTRDVAKGLGWIGFFRFGAKAIVFFKVLVAYRFLSPREVGLFGLAAIALGFLEMLTETGINIVLIRDKKPLTHFIDTAFFVSVARGIIISLILFSSSFVLPQFFRDPGLFILLIWAAVIPITKGFINPAEASFVKDLKYHKEAFFRLGLILVDVVSSILLVYRFHNALSLIWGMLIAAVAEVISSYVLLRPWPKFSFNKKIAMEIINPGKWVNLAGVVTFAEQNIDNIIVGRVLGATQLGYYQTAFNFTRSAVTEVGTSFSQVLLPIYGRIVGDEHRIRKAVIRVILPAALVMLIPVILLNTHIFQELIIFFLHDKWRPALPLFAFLSLSAWLNGMDILFSPLFLAKNHIKELTVIYSIGLVCLITALLLFTSRFGITGAATAVLVAKVLIQPFFFWRAYRMIDLNPRT